MLGERLAGTPLQFTSRVSSFVWGAKQPHRDVTFSIHSTVLPSRGHGRRETQTSTLRTIDLLGSRVRAVNHYFTMSDDLNGMAVFAAVADATGISRRRRSSRLSVSAVSQV